MRLISRICLVQAILLFSIPCLSASGLDTINPSEFFQLTDNELSPAEGFEYFDVKVAAYSDGAKKLRTIKVPAGERVDLDTFGNIQFPVGTVLTKTFYFERVEGVAISKSTALQRGSETGVVFLQDSALIETRLLVLEKNGWRPFSYSWDGEDLRRSRFGKVHRIQDAGSSTDFNYIVPSERECASCHVTDTASKELRPLGFTSTHLLVDDQLMGSKILGPEVIREFERESYNDIARLYLDVNCSHCHNAEGRAKQVGLGFSVDDELSLLGLCKKPVTYQATENELIINPDAPHLSSILVRLSSQEPTVQMPPIGRTLVHLEALNELRQWIEELPRTCDG